MMVRTMESPLAGTATLRETVRFRNSGSNSTNIGDTPSGKRWEWVLGNRGRAAGCKVAKVESPFEKADLLVIALLVIAGLGGGMVSDFARKR
jgi:hypothetical protein